MAIVHRWSQGQAKTSLTQRMFRRQADEAISGGLGEPGLTFRGLAEPAKPGSLSLQYQYFQSHFQMQWGCLETTFRAVHYRADVTMQRLHCKGSEAPDPLTCLGQAG